MKLARIALAALVLSAGPALSQHKHGHEPDPDRRLERADKLLQLTPEQEQKWKDAENARITANAPLKEKMKGSTTPEERTKIRSDIHANQMKFRETVKGFLTPAQLSKLDSLQKNHEKHGPGPHKGKRN